MIIKPNCLLKMKKRIWNPNISSKDGQWRYRDAIWHRKMCHAHNKKRKIKQITEVIERPNQEKIRTLRKKEDLQIPCEYLKRTTSNMLRWKKKKKE